MRVSLSDRPVERDSCCVHVAGTCHLLGFASQFISRVCGYLFCRVLLPNAQRSAKWPLCILDLYQKTLSQSTSRSGQRPDYVGGPPVLSNYHGTLQYLNPAAFQAVLVSNVSGAAIRPGNSGPGEWREPGQWNLDFSLAKNFKVRENMQLQIRTDMFNALNHTNLSGLRTNINDPFFGQLLSTRGARTIQLNARLTF